MAVVRCHLSKWMVQEGSQSLAGEASRVPKTPPTNRDLEKFVYCEMQRSVQGHDQVLFRSLLLLAPVRSCRRRVDTDTHGSFATLVVAGHRVLKEFDGSWKGIEEILQCFARCSRAPPQVDYDGLIFPVLTI